MSLNVIAVIYEHADDQSLRVHGFGDAEISLSLRDERLSIKGLEEVTHVQMYAEPDGSITLHHRDDRVLWEEFDA